ncbi:unnamed protein product [Fusarium graminearum]|uniref:Uncharacterized protein n=1 Tax=Gibberella zeae TaxID=5518 RepID=A0A4U9FHR5_GIBZA|nr:unnamed protein product [Fusarium graminearum]CAF3549331.1 unnamed protein product [Fusarium graminearum]CAF3586324.1 unnamed protein product [Fusarium graminearum]CAG1985783.1 unnamed protein product [Fusarium graminearum]CAG1991778.1 unnamed protein product [Fusarium graminearum]
MIGDVEVGRVVLNAPAKAETPTMAGRLTASRISEMIFRTPVSHFNSHPRGFVMSQQFSEHSQIGPF